MPNIPEEHELTAIALLHAYFKQPITILQPTNAYKRRTADILVGLIEWEIKSPTTFKPSKLESRFKDALKQSRYVVMDLRRVKIDEDRAIRQITHLTHMSRRVKGVLCITKTGSIIIIK